MCLQPEMPLSAARDLLATSSWTCERFDLLWQSKELILFSDCTLSTLSDAGQRGDDLRKIPIAQVTGPSAPIWRNLCNRLITTPMIPAQSRGVVTSRVEATAFGHRNNCHAGYLPTREKATSLQGS